MAALGVQTVICYIDDCTKPAKPYASYRGLCSKHFTRWYRHGDPTYAKGAHGTTDRIIGLIDASGDCWEWTGSVNDSGYGQLSAGRRNYRAHRFVYEQLVGPIPDGLTLDHLCRNRRCVNPDHLEPVTSGVNVQRGAARYRTGRDALGRYV